MKKLILTILLIMPTIFFAQTPPIEPGVSQELARWRAARYSDVRYKLNLTLEKMSPVLRGTMEVRVRVGEKGSGGDGDGLPIILDWRKIKGYEDGSTVSNVSINGRVLSPGFSRPDAAARPPEGGTQNSYREENEHLIFRDGVLLGENVIKLDFTSPILPSGSAITRYVDKEDGSEYIYSLFVPSDASTAFPVFDQPDLKARFQLNVLAPKEWTIMSNANGVRRAIDYDSLNVRTHFLETKPISTYVFAFAAGPWEKVSMPDGGGGNLSRSEGVSSPAAGRDTLPTGRVSASGVGSPHGSTLSGGRMEPSLTVGLPTSAADTGGNLSRSEGVSSPGAGRDTLPTGRVSASLPDGSIYVRRSQASKFKPHAAEVFRLNREAVKYFEQYFDYKFPFPKYDLVLIPEFPFGGMEHAGATFLRESAIIFPQEPTKNDLVNRATLIFHEAAHQWFGDTVTMRWFDDLWLKEGFATFTAYKALEKIMPEMNAWKVFYERIKQGAYQTDSTRGTTAIYQPIANLSAAKSAYGNIVYNKAPAFLRQAEFYLGEDKFQTAVRAFLKKHEFGNATWEDLIQEFALSTERLTYGDRTVTATLRERKALLSEISTKWITKPGISKYYVREGIIHISSGELPSVVNYELNEEDLSGEFLHRNQRLSVLVRWREKAPLVTDFHFGGITGWRFRGIPAAALPLEHTKPISMPDPNRPLFIFPNYGDYGYGIFLLDEKSRDYVLKNIQDEKDPFLRAMMWGALWDSVREGELDPRVFVELVVKVLSKSYAFTREAPSAVGTSGDPRVQTHTASVAGKSVEGARGFTPQGVTLTEEDESTVATLLGRTGTALNYYLSEPGAVATGFREMPGVKNPVATAPGSDMRLRVEDLLIERMQNAPSLGQRITYYRAFLNIASTGKARTVLKDVLNLKFEIKDLKLKTKDRFDIVTRLLILGDPDAMRLLDDLEKTETSDEAKRYAYAARAAIGTVENKAKYWNDFVSNKEISESWIEAAFGPWNSIRHSDLTLPYLERALKELPNHKRNRKIFFVNGWLGAFIGGQRSAEALAIVNKFLADNPGLDNDLRLKILENVDLIERAVNIRRKFPQV